VNFARLNHILIPGTSAERERWRGGVVGRLTRPMWWMYSALSEEGRVLSVLVLFIGTAGLDVATTQVYYLWSALMGLLVASVAVRPWLALRDVRAVVRVPARVAVNTPTTFSVHLENEHPNNHHAIRISGPFLPWDGHWVSREPRVGQLEANGSATRDMQARFVQRGRHHLDPFRACSVVPLGLAVGPTIRTDTCHFMVVPHIATVQQLRLPDGVSQQTGGRSKTMYAGEALELLGVRPYRPGDPIRNLHAKLWARHGTPHVREFQQEVYSRVGVLLDDGRANTTEEGFEASISLAAGVLAKLTRSGTLSDLLFASGEFDAVTVGGSTASLDAALDSLADCKQYDDWDLAEVTRRIEAEIATLSGLLLVTASSHPSRLQLAAALRKRGLACRVLRVEDDTQPWWLAWRREPVPARGGDETIVEASKIRDGEALRL
jgi:uncharacterized protein (DUF58 family)